MPLTGSGGGDGGAAKMERARQGRINQGMGQIKDLFGGYDDKFFDARKQAYLDYANPQVMDQYRTTKNNLAYTLARNGIMGSSAAVGEQGALDKNLAMQQNNVANAAQGQANQLREQVQNNRSNLTNQLISSGDPSVVAENSAAATANLRAPSTFQPLSNLFSDFAQTYMANQNARSYDPSTPSIWSQLAGKN